MGMMMSVLTFWRINGAARASRTVKASMVLFPCLERAYIGDAAGDRRRDGHRWTGEMRAPARPLPADEIAVGRGDAALAGRDRVAVHRQAHRAARLAPFEPAVEEGTGDPFGLRRTLDVLLA